MRVLVTLVKVKDRFKLVPLYIKYDYILSVL